MRGAGRGGPARSAAGLAVVALLLTGCDGPPMPVPSPAYTSTYIPPAPVVLAPLTGEVQAEGAVPGPSLAAKIDNHPDARPQIGLEHADLVFEELVEGGLTRYVAVWQSDVPAEIGPVRSIRPMDPDIIAPLGGIVAYSGGQFRFVEAMKATGVVNAIHGQPDTADLMFRTPDKRAPHNVVVRAPKLIAKHGDLAPPPQQFAFAPDLAGSTAVREGVAAGGIRLAFSAGSRPFWDFDPAAGVYRRGQAGAADLDPAGEPLSAVNVIVLRVPIGNDGGVPKTELIGSGVAWISSGGRTVEATWRKGAQAGLIRLVDGTGTVVRLAPGTSWIELVPTAGSVDFQP
ncbi:MAG TPA: DUF3048 domain-containing protein [Pseudolysinimonas sp.]|nr:DUF3048 domain-containing protein [Pseudolysinimonas sp.]